jgi:hypothetical protein
LRQRYRIDMIVYCDYFNATLINLGSSEMISKNEFVDIVVDIAGIKFERK